MDVSLFIVVGVVTVVAVSASSKRLGIASPLLLVLVGIGYSFIPGAPEIVVAPEIILTGVLPPLLYSAAITVPIVDFRRNLGTISALSVLLVVVSAFGTGYLLFLLFPDLTFPAALALGAVISPPDVVAATAIGRRLGLPPRLLTILEGEGLLNDATALVLLRTAIAATATTVTFTGAVLDFLYAASAAVVIGLIVGWLTVRIRGRLRDSVLDTAVSFAVPFIAFIPAEEVGASGVIAVVVAGLVAGHGSARYSTAQARISERLNWRTVQFVLENGVFLVMGVEILPIIARVEDQDRSVVGAVGVGLLCTAILILLRFLFVGPLLLALRRGSDRAERVNRRLTVTVERLRGVLDPTARESRRKERAERIARRRAVDLTALQAQGLGWRGGIVLSWAGMRGVVTLAAAQSLPTDIPYREQLVLIAFTVAIATLLLQGSTLPLVIRTSGIRGADRDADRREFATLLEDLSQAGIDALEHPSFRLPGGGDIDEDILTRVRADTLIGTESAWERARQGTDEDALLDSPHRQYRALRREVLEAERAALLDARSEGVYASRLLARAQVLLDLEETRLQQFDEPGPH
jgi:NhaP-type Na+/H+ or K+/H+ antiporter